MNMNSELRSPYIYEGIEYMTLFYMPLSHKALVHTGYSYGICQSNSVLSQEALMAREYGYMLWK